MSKTLRCSKAEFYDALDTTQPERLYTLSWPGDMEVTNLTLQVQQPFGASDLRVIPPVEEGQRRDDGLLYYPADLGSQTAGQTLKIELAYRKTDSRTSVEALQLTLPTPAPTPGQASSPASLPVWMIAGIGLGIVLIVAGVIWQVHARREEESTEYVPPAVRRDRRGRSNAVARGHAVARSHCPLPPDQGQPAPAGFCTQCGRPLRAADTFCPQCGTRRRDPGGDAAQ